MEIVFICSGFFVGFFPFFFKPLLIQTNDEKEQKMVPSFSGITEVSVLWET